MNKASINLRRVTISALLLSLALVLKLTTSLYIPMFGQNGMRVGVSGIFSMLPAFLFGPVFGMIVAGLADLLGYLLKPAGDRKSTSLNSSHTVLSRMPSSA